jgi:ribosomal protein S18
LKKEKEYFQDLMKDQEQKINEYLKNRKMNYKNIRMLTDLVNFYNSLEKPF